MTDWSDVEFVPRSPASGRGGGTRAQDLLPAYADVLTFLDLVTCIVAGEMALALYAAAMPARHVDISVAGPFWPDIIFGSVIAALLLRNSAALANHEPRYRQHLVAMALQRCAAAFAILIVVGLATRVTDTLSRLWMFSWLVIFAGFLVATRVIIGSYLLQLRNSGRLRESVAIIGAGDMGERLAARLADTAHIVGLFEPALHQPAGFAEAGTSPLAPPPRDGVSRLLELGRQGGVDSVILAMERGREAHVAKLVERLKALPVQVALCPDECWPHNMVPHVRMLGGLPITVVADRPLQRWDMIFKNLFDRLGAAVLLLLLAPLMVAIALAIALTSPGPVIFRQARSGWCGRDFTVFKFRTMLDGADQKNGEFQAVRNDARCTPVGRVLRRTSLDELPQLFNVLRGEMSLVGPRPHVDKLLGMDKAGHAIIAEYAQRNRVKPGITGWAQIHGARGPTTTIDQLQRRVELDLYYIDNWSIWFDVQILARTLFCLAGENAF